MCKDFLKTENFKTRIMTGVLLLVIVTISFFTPQATGFRILFFAAGIMAWLELYLAHSSGFYRGIPMPDERIIVVEYVVIFLAVYAIGFYFERYEILLVVLGAISTDIFAYFIGSMFHGKFFKTRPFPLVSPKKSWEGIIGGFIGCIVTLLSVIWFFEIPLSAEGLTFLLFCPVVSIFGDWLASFCKRFLKIKDSSDCIYISPFSLPKLFEKLMKGHGGYLDRIDSISAVASLMFLTKLASK